MEKEFLKNYIKEELRIFKMCFGSTKGFKEYITRSLRLKLQSERE